MMKRIVELADLKLEENQIISISFVGPKTIAKVNKQFLNHIGATDIISFDYRDSLDNDDDVVAELVVCPNVAILEGLKRKKSSFANEMVLYLVHGVLHIAGEDDLTPEKRSRMRRRERKIMNKLQKEFSFDSIFQKIREQEHA